MKKRIVTYSLLALINDESTSVTNYESIFIPIVKRGLSKMCASGQYKGDDLIDIKKHIEDLYDLSMPLTVLKRLLNRIEVELNKDKELFRIYSDGSFFIKEFVFSEYEDNLTKKTEELNSLENFYEKFLEAEGEIKDGDSIFNFVEENKYSLGKYIGKKYPQDFNDNTIAARFVNFIKPFDGLYKTIQSVYVGSIISTYLEYDPIPVKNSVELVLDTNFIISLIDLNTASSRDNCNRLLEISSKLGYNFTVLAITIKEVEYLLRMRVENFDTAFLSKIADPEDIYNACERRKLSKTDLDRIRANIVEEIERRGVLIIPNTEKFENRAKNSSEYERLKGVRNSSFAALHDATCIDYVREKRRKVIHNFEKVNCWFLNNSSTRSTFYTNGVQPYSIKAEDLLNLLWLASPQVRAKIVSNDLSEIGLARLVSSTLDNSLPSPLTIQLLDRNIQKYAKDNITDEDIIRVGKAVAERTLSNLDELNSIASEEPKVFVQKLQFIANTQKEKEEEFSKHISKMVDEITRKSAIWEQKIDTIDKERVYHQEIVDINSGLLKITKKLGRENVDLKNQIREKERERYIFKRVVYWRGKAFLLVLLGPVLTALFLFVQYKINKSSWQEVKVALEKNVFISVIVGFAALLYTGIFLKIFSDRYNASSLNAYKNNLDIPETLKHLPYEDE